MQHRFLPIFSNFVTIALCAAVSMGVLFTGCAEKTTLPAASAAAVTAAPTPQPTDAPTPTPYRDLLETVTADTPIEEHPFYLAPVPTVREDAQPPLTAAPASKDRENGTSLSDGNYSYIRYDDGTAGLVGCSFPEASHNFDLPETVDGLTVTGIEPSFMPTLEPATHHHPRNDIIVRIPKGVRYIGANFAEAETMLEIDLEISADNPYFQTVGNSVFSADGTLLHSYYSDPVMMHPQVYIVPETVRHIGDGAFYHCQELIHVQLPEELSTIGAYAFEGCGNLSLLTLPASVISVGEGAFGGFAMTLYVQGRGTDLGGEPTLDAIAEICCDDAAAAAAYAKEHDIPQSDVTPTPIGIALDPATRHLVAYTLQSDGTAKILRIHSDSQRDFTLPETIGGYPVTALGYEALLYINEKHEDYPVCIRVPDCITSIDAGALWPETITGSAGSEAERFAEEEGIEFIAE